MFLRILVSGANGFLGRPLVSRLLAGGHEVHRIVRSAPEGSDVHLDLSARRLDDHRLSGGISSIDAVFHLMGEPITPTRWGPAKRERLRSSRIATTDLLARALAAGGPPGAVLLCASAIGIYGDRGEELVDEDAPAGVGFLAELCRSWERACEPARAAGLRVVNLRSGLVLGPGGGVIAAQLPLFRIGLGARLGDGRQWNSWISLEDALGAMLHALGCAELSGPCNLVAPEPVRNRELTERLATVVGRRARLALPAPLLELAIGRRTAGEVALASQRVRPARLAETGYRHVVPELSEALQLAVGAGAR